MANILLLSSIYPWPSKDNQGTPVCHYFTREWVKMGHNVRVVHTQNVFPAPYYWLSRLFRGKIAAKTGAVVYTKRDRGAVFVMDGVQVNRIPILKPFPHGKFSKGAVIRSVNKIVQWLNAETFTPDIIVGHFPNPQIEMVGMLRDVWPNAKTVIVMHGDIKLAKKVYGDRLLGLCNKIDLWGFRSEPVRQLFERMIVPVKKSFICYSGIPGDYITTENKHDFNKPLSRFVYVGEMIERKYPLQILDALHEAYPDGGYQITYVGDGDLLNAIKKRVEQEKLCNNVTITGKIPRDNIKEQYDLADCMVMISRAEAYGLVYLEAMARGCITIASRNEGFDGVIRDGENGFLCEAGNSKELSSVICRIKSLTATERKMISENAILTAKSLTDYMAAKRYIEDMLE